MLFRSRNCSLRELEHFLLDPCLMCHNPTFHRSCCHNRRCMLFKLPLVMSPKCLSRHLCDNFCNLCLGIIVVCIIRQMPRCFLSSHFLNPGTCCFRNSSCRMFQSALPLSCIRRYLCHNHCSSLLLRNRSFLMQGIQSACQQSSCLNNLCFGIFLQSIMHNQLHILQSGNPPLHQNRNLSLLHSPQSAPNSLNCSLLQQFLNIFLNLMRSM